MDATVIVPLFGDIDRWAPIAQRAVRSALDNDWPALVVQGDTLADARNRGLDLAATEWVVMLDADDQLEPGFADRMADRLAVAPDTDVLVPSVRYVREHDSIGQLPCIPKVWGHEHDCSPDCLAWGNWIVIGAPVRTRLLCGGDERTGWALPPWPPIRFDRWPVYEDWPFWVDCWQRGARFERVPEAVYRAHVRPESRNRGSATPDAKLETHRDIARARGLPVP